MPETALIRGKAPLRISFAGGGTDVEPYLSERGGLVLSTTIDKHAYVSIRCTAGKSITVQSLDYDVVAKYQRGGPIPEGDVLYLVKSVIARMCEGAKIGGLEFFLHNDAPPGSGLGSSSAIVVVLIGAFKQLLHLPLTHYQIASLAYELERNDLGILGGKQDQYATTFGGFNFIEFFRDGTIVNPLRIHNNTLNELHYALLLCYTGGTRQSDRIIEAQVDGYVRRREYVVAAMDDLKQVAIDMKNALLQDRVRDFGALLDAGWTSKKKMAVQISTPFIDEMYEEAQRAGALGGKITGAGGGGYLLLFCDFQRKHRVAQRIEELGGKVVTFNFDRNGMETWEVR